MDKAHVLECVKDGSRQCEYKSMSMMLSIGNIMVVSIVVGSTLPYGFFIFSFYVKPFLVAKQYPPLIFCDIDNGSQEHHIIIIHQRASELTP